MLLMARDYGYGYVFFITQPCRLAHQRLKMLRGMGGVEPAITHEITGDAIILDKGLNPVK